jgi:hypothetical protein
VDVKLGVTPGFELMTFEILCNYSPANWCVNCWKCEIRRIRSLWHFTPTVARDAWTGPLTHGDILSPVGITEDLPRERSNVDLSSPVLIATA